MSQQNSNSNVILYFVIGILAFLLVAGGVGAIIYINNQKSQAIQDALEKENAKLKADLDEQMEENDEITSKQRTVTTLPEQKTKVKK
ncbi:MAG: hypothetical protein II199_06790, partial [Bacteroidaceae bacterium]|nr:hypothetical protein [Bacteroidaceae bacterium]